MRLCSLAQSIRSEEGSLSLTRYLTFNSHSSQLIQTDEGLLQVQHEWIHIPISQRCLPCQVIRETDDSLKQGLVALVGARTISQSIISIPGFFTIGKLWHTQKTRKSKVMHRPQLPGKPSKGRSASPQPFSLATHSHLYLFFLVYITYKELKLIKPFGSCAKCLAWTNSLHLLWLLWAKNRYYQPHFIHGKLWIEKELYNLARITQLLVQVMPLQSQNS